MKCCKCFFACFISKEIYGVPVLHCKFQNKDFTYGLEQLVDTDRIRFEIGCDIPWQTVAKAEKEVIKKLKGEVDNEN